MKYLLVLFSVLMLAYQCPAQGGYVPPKVPEKICKALNELVLAADGGSIEMSITEIRELIKKYPTWTEPRHHLSRILYESGKKEEAVEVLEATLAIDTNSQLQQLYALGRLYEETGQYDKAIWAFNTVIKKGIHQQGLVQRATASLKALEDKAKLLKSDYSITLIPVSDKINTPHHEYLGRWTLDGKQVIFTRRINEQEDLFIASFNKDGVLMTIEELPFNSEFNEAGHAISPDGKNLIFTSCDRKDGLGGCDLYLSVRKENQWTTPVNMGPAFNTPGWDSQPVFGLDGLSIYFTSNRAGGFGGSDIWMLHEISRGKWSKPINAGPQINTANNEESPFLHFDGRTMYFMRDGKDGLGGFDLYFAHQGIDGKWLSAENMKAPINSGTDEGALAVHPDGRNAMITRMTSEQKNDLFQFELPAKFQSRPVQVLYVHVTDAKSMLPVRARLDIFDINKSDTIRLSQWADENGNITVTLNRNESYGLISSAENYIMHSTNLHADTGAIRRLEIKMVALAESVDKTIVLENIFFETGSARLLPSSHPELNKLVWTLRNNAGMQIEIRGHTDNVGSDHDNQSLSEARAKSVYQYLIDRGIASTRLSYKGFGETKPVASNETHEGRQQNRRTEFVVISNQ